MKRVTSTVGPQAQVPCSDAVDCTKERRMEREREVEEGRMVLPERCNGECRGQRR